MRIARAWVVLMKRLGYTRFVAQGGDWGNAITEQMALLAPPELLGIHTNMPATVPADDMRPLVQAEWTRPSISLGRRTHAYDQLDSFYKHGLGYATRDVEPASDAIRHRRFTGRAWRPGFSIMTRAAMN